jgi:DNA polymerase I-like protein with 3'-5' exonuclease and polymerase domains
MRLVFDIEADGLYWSVKELYCIVAYDLDTKVTHTFSPGEISEGLDFLFSADKLIGHNICRYDIPVIEKFGKRKYTGAVIDTLVISRLMNPDIRQNPMGGNSLKHWGEHLGNKKLEFHTFDEGFSLEMMKYCVQDVMLNVDILMAQAEYYKENKKIVDFEILISKLCFNQEINGFGYDLKGGQELEQSMLSERAGLLDNLRTIFPDKVEERWSKKTDKRLKDKITPFNPQSGAQVFERLVKKYPQIEKKIKFSDAGNPQMDTHTLGYLNKKFEIPEIKDILGYRENLKLYGQVQDWNAKAEASPDGRIHGEVNTQGAGSGRCTHANPNVAQVTKNDRMRSLWIPGLPDYVQVGCDLSGLELRMLAHYMNAYDGGSYADQILNGDIHTTNQEAAGLATRDMAKKFIYTFLYGAGDASMALDMGTSVPEMKRLKSQFLETLPALKNVIDDVHRDFNFDGRVQLPDGRWVQCRTEHAALNTKLQGAGAIVSKYWMLVADMRLRATDIRYKQMAYVHDEVQYAVHKDDAERACKIITDASLEAGERLKIGMPIHSEAMIGKNWWDTH